MKFDRAAGINPIDQLSVVGQPVARIEGHLKATGRATYAYEWHDPVPDAAYGEIVGAGIAKGRIETVDTDAAARMPGVRTVVTAQNSGPLSKGEHNTAILLGGPEVQHYHQAVALVVADTFEQARDAARAVKITYSSRGGAYDLAAGKEGSQPAEAQDAPADTQVGDFDGAFRSAPVRLDQTYTTPDQSHAMMEPHATVASWSDDTLTVWTSNQMVAWAVRDLAATLRIEREKVRVLSPYIGGGFGGKLFLRADVVLAALGARATRRPVKVALPRHLIFNNTTHRPATIQRIRIGATRDGKITAIGHESWSGDLEDGKPEAAVQQTRLLYAGANRMTATRLAVLDLPEGNAMRAPGEASGMMALEIAIDEMAEQLGLDPIEFRILNDTQIVPDSPDKSHAADPQSKAGSRSASQQGLAFSQRRLVECLRIGADLFGWGARASQPLQRREGRWQIGMGVAAAFRNNILMTSGARVRLTRSGNVIVETDMTDIGTGSYTIIAQTAAEMTGVPLERVEVRLGDSRLPVSAGSGGQWGGNSSTAGVYAACVKLREAIVQRLGLNAADAVFRGGFVLSGDRSVPLREAVRQGELVAEDSIEFGEIEKQHQQSTFGAHFVEVAVDTATAETRVRRMLAVCDCGRILNPRTARSQVIGAMTMGVGAALMEGLVVDKRHGFFANHDLAQYEVPVHADIPHQDVLFLAGEDPMSSPMKAKGVAELGICGVAAAIANAIYNATGVRVRDYPITLDKVFEGISA
ncbi:MAG: aldehyde oxidoreductase molybdenum-binding subunit PaoC [Hyphomicrobiaceae bacterium]|nr:aldehyde oxidoreductase molybdenum-binding subunit PaoC [Hyphomicrobiaceae bacterium]